MQKLVRYFQQSSSELQKVTWPTRRVATRLTLTVIVFSFILAVVIGLIDVVLTKGLEALINS